MGSQIHRLASFPFHLHQATLCSVTVRMPQTCFSTHKHSVPEERNGTGAGLRIFQKLSRGKECLNAVSSCERQRYGSEPVWSRTFSVGAVSAAPSPTCGNADRLHELMVADSVMPRHLPVILWFEIVNSSPYSILSSTSLSHMS